MGIETEYGISVPGHPNMNPMVSSSQIVNAYGQFALRGARHKAHWDYEVESPLRDARGFDMTRAEADPSQLTDDDLGMANVILTNGSRLYVDHAHPELSTPEVTNPRDAVLWDRAGVEIMRAAMRLAAAVPQSHPIVLYKNNTDNKGASYGCHENYLMQRTTPFGDIVRHLTPFFITRQVFTGAGRLGVGQDGRVSAFQISQRADFFEVEVGLETTLKRPIINTRDEPHADPERYRRLHVIVGDANLSDTATYLKIGTTAVVLAMLEEGFLRGRDWTPARPVSEMHAVSHDVGLAHEIVMTDGRRMTALQVQWELYALADEFCRRGDHADLDAATEELLDEWRRVLEGLGSDPDSLADRIDWIAKRQPHGRLRAPRRPRVGLAAASAHRPAVLGHPAGQGPGRPARGAGSAASDVHGRRGRPGGRRGTRGHPGLLPGGVHPPLPQRHRGGVVGLGRLRRARDGSRCCACRPSIRSAAPAPTSPRCWTRPPMSPP